jgi:hypothetical protein
MRDDTTTSGFELLTSDILCTKFSLDVLEGQVLEQIQGSLVGQMISRSVKLHVEFRMSRGDGPSGSHGLKGGTGQRLAAKQVQNTLQEVHKNILHRESKDARKMA